MKTVNEILLCECFSTEHQIIFSYIEDEEYNKDNNVLPAYFGEVFMHIHLYSRKGFFSKLKYAIKYIFGYKCKYGAWEEMILSLDDIEKLEKIVQFMKKSKKIKEELEELKN